MKKARNKIQMWILIASLLLGQFLLTCTFLSTRGYAASAEKALEKKENNAEKIHFNSDEEPLYGFSMNQHLGLTPPYIPVVKPAVIKSIWIPPHALEGNKDVFIEGHWVHIRIQDEAWYIDNDSSDPVDFPVIIPTVGVSE